MTIFIVYEVPAVTVVIAERNCVSGTDSGVDAPAATRLLSMVVLSRIRSNQQLAPAPPVLVAIIENPPLSLTSPSAVAVKPTESTSVFVVDDATGMTREDALEA